MTSDAALEDGGNNETIGASASLETLVENLIRTVFRPERPDGLRLGNEKKLIV